MNFKFNGDKYAIGGIQRVDFQGVSIDEETKTKGYPIVVLKNGDNEISNEEFEYLKNSLGYDRFVKDGVFEPGTPDSEEESKVTTEEEKPLATPEETQLSSKRSGTKLPGSVAPVPPVEPQKETKN